MKRSRARSPEAIEFARAERAAANEFANTVWQWVRNRQICHQKFRREHPIPPYTADFCCVEFPGYDVLREGSRTLELIERQFKLRMRELGVEGK